MPYIIQIRQGNLLDIPNADFIVNASNNKLILGSGVSMAFKKHCGMELQEEMQKRLDEIEITLHQGDVVATSSASAKNFKYALHAVVIDYNKGIYAADKFPTIKTIFDILKNIEKYLMVYWEQHNEKIKLVLPLLGCGIGRLKKEDVVEVYKKFFTRDIAIDCEIIVYEYNKNDYKSIKNVLNIH